MSNIEFNLANLAMALVASHVITVFIGYSIHWILHQAFLGFPLYKVHLNSHHSINEFSSLKTCFSATIEHAIWLLFVGSVFGVYFTYMQGWLLLAFLIQSGVTIAITYYLHLEYANPKPWLDRYRWFRRDRELHRIHHGCDRARFNQSCNYSFGGVTGYAFDRLLGTFQPLSAKEEKKLALEED